MGTAPCIDCPGIDQCGGPCLASYAPDQEAMRKCMDKVRGHSVSLNVLTFPTPPLAVQCDGSYTCGCPKCRAEVEALVRAA